MGKSPRWRCTFEAGRVGSWRAWHTAAGFEEVHGMNLAARRDTTQVEEAMERRAVPAPGSGVLGQQPFDTGGTSGGFLHTGIMLLALRYPGMAEHHSSSCCRNRLPLLHMMQQVWARGKRLFSVAAFIGAQPGVCARRRAWSAPGVPVSSSSSRRSMVLSFYAKIG